MSCKNSYSKSANAGSAPQFARAGFGAENLDSKDLAKYV